MCIPAHDPPQTYVQRLQLNEIWSFVYSKARNVPQEKQGQFGRGDVWTWTAMCADSKLIVSWLLGARDSGFAQVFVQDLSSCLANRVKLTSDGHKAYLEAVERAFGDAVDYSQLIKLYGPALEG